MGNALLPYVLLNHALWLYLPLWPARVTFHRLFALDPYAQLLCVSLQEYTSAQMTYDLRRLRLKGLIERIGKSHCYRLTKLGIKIATFFTKLHRRVFQPGLSACLQEQTTLSDLAQALSQVSTILDAWFQQKMLLPVPL